ncbi:hypothetical protein GJV85_01180 [Sulfurimonas aquatica]|uniref:Nitrous oxide-stimulated promoter family protein n=1 Tax=Sulfurimonas aquatica TaxID=2672570 RepID=A0A975AY77_9BACT|nr:nitrous oxide-stimulated promoter family protein [Sulfurimonas aquatica]QSZ40782.1 hypothetical protein GJV85_01180 [Sulfurimonas aquatica]
MKREIYLKNLKDLETFFNYYCENEHSKSHKNIINVNDDAELHLCLECAELFEYAHDRLGHCKLDPKPKCRTCEDKCYDKQEWKKMAKLMKYSGIRLGLIKLKNKLLFK